MNDTLAKALIGLGTMAVIAVLGLLLAFPLKWTWNYVMPYLFGLPVLTWGKAWCLSFVANMLIKATLNK